MISTHPKVGMAVLVGVRVKAKVRALARRDALSFLAVRAVCCIVALCCCSGSRLKSGRWRAAMRIRSLPCGRFAASQRCGTLLRLLFSHLRGGLYMTG